MAIGIDFEGGEGDYAFAERLDGVKHLGLWLLPAAADACFGTSRWPADLPRPQASIEFEVADVAAAAEELLEGGLRLLHEPRTEPWGQTVARLLSADWLLVAVCHTPHLREGRHLTDQSGDRWLLVTVGATAQPVRARSRLSGAQPRNRSLTNRFA